MMFHNFSVAIKFFIEYVFDPKSFKQNYLSSKFCFANFFYPTFLQNFNPLKHMLIIKKNQISFAIVSNHWIWTLLTPPE